MLSKFKIERKECVETESWVKLLYSSDAIDEKLSKNSEIFISEYGALFSLKDESLEKWIFVSVNKLY